MVTQISEKEFRVSNNIVSIIEPNIIYVIAEGEQTNEIALIQKEINQKLAETVDSQIHYLVDLNKCGKNSPLARKIWFELSEEDKTDKVAIFGVHPVAKVIASFVMKLSKKKNQYFFKNKQEAMNWLRNS